MLELHDGGLYKLGCKSGVLDSFYTRNQFSPTNESFMTLDDVNMDRVIPLRTADGEESMGGGKASSSVLVPENVSTKYINALKLIEGVTQGATTEELVPMLTNLSKKLLSHLYHFELRPL